MYCVYIIQSQKTKELYYGYSTNIQQRLLSHNDGENIATKHGIPWMLVYCEIFRSKKDARQRELMLKQYGNARTILKKRIINCLL